MVLGPNIEAQSSVGAVCKGRNLKDNVSERQMRRRRRANNELPEESEKRISKTMMRRNAMTLLECSTAWAFRWFHGAFYCSYCDVKFVDIQPLKEHVFINHLNEPPSKRIFAKLTENNMVKIDVNNLRCRICNIPLNGIESLKYHVQTHGRSMNEGYNDGVLPFKLDDEGYFCQICSSYFGNFTKINEHMNIHYQNYVCDTCGKGFVSKSRFRTHIHAGYNFYEKGSYPCGICDEILSSKAERNTHRLRVHRKGVRYTCPRCSETFTSYNARVKHLVNYHAQQVHEFECDVCGKSFYTRSKRAGHYKLVHTAPGQQESHQCAQCLSVFVSKCKLVKHLKSHTAT